MGSSAIREPVRVTGDCEPDPEACDGKSHFNVGKCASTGAWRRVTTCAPSECRPFFCKTTGAGDLDAYCTHHDCSGDPDCPAGYYCGVTRDPHDICGNTCDGGLCSHNASPCDVDGDCQKGNSPFCGETAEDCIDPASFEADGAQYVEGSVCLLRRTCLERPPCVPCETNLDCSRIGGRSASVRRRAGLRAFLQHRRRLLRRRAVPAESCDLRELAGIACEVGDDCPPIGKCFEGGACRAQRT